MAHPGARRPNRSRGARTDQRSRGPIALAALIGFALLGSACGHGAAVSYDSSARSQTGPGGAQLERGGADPITGNIYKNPGVNAYVETTVNPASTFALDVDTGSYSVARNYVNRGQRPDADSVRVEEYVNYFTQDYPAPVGADFGITIDGAPTPWLRDQNSKLVRVGIKGRDVSGPVRKDAALTFVIDTSGSMAEGGRLNLVTESLSYLLDELGPTDSVAIVEFGDSARTVLPPTPASDRTTIRRALTQLRADGSTNAADGLRLGYESAKQSFKPGQVNRVILASDGVANVGISGPDGLAAQIRAQSNNGIQLVTVGVGNGNYNDNLMEQLADKGDGFYVYIDSLDEGRRVFRERFTSTIETIALDGKAGVVFDPAKVAKYRLIGFENRTMSTGQYNADVPGTGGQVNAGHTITALYELTLTPAALSDPAATLGTAGMKWTDPNSKAVQGIVQPITTTSIAPSWDSAPARLQLDATVAQYAEVLRRSPYATATMADVANRADALPASIRSDHDVAEFIELTRQAVRLSS